MTAKRIISNSESALKEMQRLISISEEKSVRQAAQEPVAVNSGRLNLGVPSQAGSSAAGQSGPSQMDLPVAPKNKLLKLAQSDRIDAQAPKTAFEEVDTPHEAVANSPVEPSLSRERVAEIARNVYESQKGTETPAQIEARVGAAMQEALEQQSHSVLPVQIEARIDQIAPQHISNIFAEVGPAYVEKMVDEMAPEQISALAQEIIPALTQTIVSEQVADFLSDSMGPALQNQISNSIRKELSGAMGQRVTEKIRMLINTEIIKLRATHRL